MMLKIAEIGLNHMGRMSYLYEYVKFLSKKKNRSCHNSSNKKRNFRQILQKLLFRR